MNYDFRFTQKKPIPFPLIKDEVYSMGKGLLDVQEQALFYFGFLSGSRISEILKVRKARVKDQGDELTAVIPILKRRRPPFIHTLPIGKYQDPVEKQMSKRILDYIDTLPEKEDLLFPGVTRFTADKWLRRHIPPINILALNPKTRDFLELDNFIVHCHYLRHCRLTDLVISYDFGHVDLMSWAGWTDPKMCDTYIMMNWRQLSDKMRIRGVSNA